MNPIQNHIRATVQHSCNDGEIPSQTEISRRELEEVCLVIFTLRRSRREVLLYRSSRKPRSKTVSCANRSVSSRIRSWNSRSKYLASLRNLRTMRRWLWHLGISFVLWTSLSSQKWKCSSSFPNKCEFWPIQPNNSLWNTCFAAPGVWRRTISRASSRSTWYHETQQNALTHTYDIMIISIFNNSKQLLVPQWPQEWTLTYDLSALYKCTSHFQHPRRIHISPIWDKPNDSKSATLVWTTYWCWWWLSALGTDFVPWSGYIKYWESVHDAQL